MQPNLVEHNLIEKYAGQGIDGDRKIAVSEAVSSTNRLPEEIRNLGHNMMKMYINARIKKIEEHNERILEAIRKDSMELKEATRGWGTVVCPECLDDIPWGSILSLIAFITDGINDYLCCHLAVM